MDEPLTAFLAEYDDAMRDYEKGYTDADATLERVSKAVELLRAAEADADD